MWCSAATRDDDLERGALQRVREEVAVQALNVRGVIVLPGESMLASSRSMAVPYATTRRGSRASMPSPTQPPAPGHIPPGLLRGWTVVMDVVVPPLRGQASRNLHPSMALRPTHGPGCGWAAGIWWSEQPAVAARWWVAVPYRPVVEDPRAQLRQMLAGARGRTLWEAHREAAIESLRLADQIDAGRDCPFFCG